MFKRSLHYTSSLGAVRKPQFDVKKIISQLPLYVDTITERKLLDSNELICRLKQLPDEQARLGRLNKAIKEVQVQRKGIEDSIKHGKTSVVELQGRLKELKQQFQIYSEEKQALHDSMLITCLALPNLTHTSVPSSNPEIVEWVNPMNEYNADPKRDHKSIMLEKGMVDFQSASDVTGPSWYYLMNDGAALEQALINYVSDKARKWGFNMCIPPSIAKTDIIAACGFRPKDMNNERQIYYLQDSQLGLTATAEITLAGLGLNKVLNLDLIRPMFGISRSYRAEAGASGKDTKGLYRVHEFTKVELFYWSAPEDSEKKLETLRAFQTEVFKELGLPAVVLNMPKDDLGAPAFKKYDIEAWMPGRGSFGEVSSTSNCTDFQSRRLNTKFVDKSTGKLEYVHTLNGTAMAIPRVILAIVENFYNPSTQKVHIPNVLQPYMGGRDEI